MKSRLDQIEDRLQALIENSLQGFPPDYLKHRLLSSRLVEALEENLARSDGSSPLQNFYTVFTHPDNLAYWNAQDGLLESLALALQEAALDAGVMIKTAPLIRVAADPEMSIEEIRVVNSYSEEALSQTAVLEVADRKSASPSDTPGSNAFLILPGSNVFPLEQAVVNIGRRNSNHVVIDDPRVSREHAQLRIVRGRYTLFDLNSTGGTYVNNQRINQLTLKPGDVISLAGVTIIYGEERIGPQDETGKIQGSPAPADGKS
ncbi:MAG: FHA domain-containing protein [Chloroflexi bacterium]|nr:FHA domain-containing protein [Chloroflexota bacterium]